MASSLGGGLGHALDLSGCVKNHLGSHFRRSMHAMAHVCPDQAAARSYFKPQVWPSRSPTMQSNVDKCNRLGIVETSNTVRCSKGPLFSGSLPKRASAPKAQASAHSSKKVWQHGKQITFLKESSFLAGDAEQRLSPGTTSRKVAEKGVRLQRNMRAQVSTSRSSEHRPDEQQEQGVLKQVQMSLAQVKPTPAEAVRMRKSAFFALVVCL
jgi:hypothetical protein